MAIANRTTAEVQLLKKNLYNTLKGLENYDSDSRNPAMAAGVDTLLTALKTQVDATVADVTAVSPPENPAI
jgi:hypothetical protein